MGTDFLRSCQRRPCQFIEADGLRVPIRWFFVDGVDVLPIAEAFGTRAISPEEDEPGAIGEQLGRRKWDPGRDPGYEHCCYQGKPEWFYSGLPASELSGGLPVTLCGRPTLWADGGPVVGGTATWVGWLRGRAAFGLAARGALAVAPPPSRLAGRARFGLAARGSLAAPLYTLAGRAGFVLAGRGTLNVLPAPATIAGRAGFVLAGRGTLNVPTAPVTIAGRARFGLTARGLIMGPVAVLAGQAFFVLAARGFPGYPPVCSRSTVWTFTMSGVADGTCLDSALYNGSFTLTSVRPDRWATVEMGACEASSTGDRPWRYQLFFDPSFGNLILGAFSLNGSLLASWFIDPATIDCSGANVLALLYPGAGELTGWPVSVTLSAS